MATGYCYGCMEIITAYPCSKCGYSPMHDTVPFALQPGTILGKKYLIGRVLGQGGFGITYIGMDLQLQRKVAIKEYYPAGFVGRNPGTSQVVWYTGEGVQEARLSGQETFLKEARKMSKVSNIGPVAQVYNVFQENGTAYICMEFIEGRTLQAHLKRTGPLSWVQAQKIFFPVIDTMEAVHRQGLIHRDLSPDNLMIQPNGGVKILDLGAAKDMNLNSGKSSMQVAKSGFSPLEQYTQTGNSGTWTDVYAMAATMYYSLTGVIPPSAIDRMDQDSLNWNLPQLQAVPPAAIEALKRALAVRSGDRTQTMEAFSRDLRGERSGGRKPPKWLIPVAAVAAAAVIIAAVVGITSGSNQNTGPEKPSSSVSSQTSTADPSLDAYQGRIDKLIKACTREIYDYRNGAQMELYFDSQGNECLRIFINEEGHDEFLFLAEYDEDGNVLESYGFEGQTLTRHSLWTRNEDGNATEIKKYGADGILIEKTEIRYGSDGRETSRTRVDGNGNTLLRANSVYDASGAETYSGTNQFGENFVYTYSADGNLLESRTTDQSGRQLSRTTYEYDRDGNQTHYCSYDENNAISYRSEYHYSSGVQTGYTFYSYYDGTEHPSDTNYIFGPRNIQFGQTYGDGSYTSSTEYVEDMFNSWRLRDFSYSTDSYSSYQIVYYDWSWDSYRDESFDADGNLVGKSESIYDESGKKTGSKHYWYNEDGSYSITVYDANYRTEYSEDYNSSGTLVSKTVYQHGADGTQIGSVCTDYNEDGSYTESERDASYHTTVSRTYDGSGALVSMAEYSYDSSGKRTGSVLTTYYYDGSYMVTVKDADSRTVSETVYDASGQPIS